MRCGRADSGRKCAPSAGAHDRPVGATRRFTKRAIRPGTDVSHTCGACGATLGPSETIHVAGEGPRCYPCFNREIAGRIGLDYDELFPRLFATMRDAVATRYVRRTEFGWQLTSDQRLVGRIEWDPESEARLPRVVIDGKAFSWEQVGHMLMTFEGFTLETRVKDTIEIVGDYSSI